MKKITAIGLAAICLAFILQGCKKETTTAATQTNTQKLTDKNWYITAQVTSPGIPDGMGGTKTDMYADMGACERDNYERYSANGSYYTDEGLTKCQTGDPQNVPGTWQFQSHETKLSLDGGLVFDIVKLEGNTLIVKYTTDVLGSTQTITITMTAK